MVPTYVALLYSVVLTPQKRVVMADLRAMVEDMGFENVRTLVSSGNVVFTAAEKCVPSIEARLEAAFEERFGRAVPVIVRNADAWERLVDANPFPDESAATPDQVAVRVMRRPVATDAIDALRQAATPDERIEIVDGDPWIFFSRERPNSRLLGAVNHKRFGIGTSRNWNTVRGLAAMLADT